MSCQIFIKNVKGQTRTVCVNSEEELKNMTVEEFFRRFCLEEEDLYRCRYISDGRRLEGDRTLGYYGIEHGSTINMTLLLRGGGGGALTGPDEDEDEDKGMSRTESMEILAIMQQTEAESSSSCCIL